MDDGCDRHHVRKTQRDHHFRRHRRDSRRYCGRNHQQRHNHLAEAACSKKFCSSSSSMQQRCCCWCWRGIIMTANRICSLQKRVGCISYTSIWCSCHRSRLYIFAACNAARNPRAGRMLAALQSTRRAAGDAMPLCPHARAGRTGHIASPGASPEHRIDCTSGQGYVTHPAPYNTLYQAPMGKRDGV